MGDAQLFLVRIWRHFSGSFRASVRRVDEEQSRLFTTADELARFFGDAATDVDGPAARHEDPPDPGRA
jgi:hypothetical protein